MSASEICENLTPLAADGAWASSRHGWVIPPASTARASTMIRTEFLELDRLITSSKPVVRLDLRCDPRSIQKIGAGRRFSVCFSLNSRSFAMSATKRWSLIWLIAIPVIVGAVTGWFVAWRTPPQYRSQAVIMVIPARVASEFVRPMATTLLEDRLAPMRQIVLSRTRLEHVIQDYDLYKTERKTMIMEDVFE